MNEELQKLNQALKIYGIEARFSNFRKLGKDNDSFDLCIFGYFNGLRYGIMGSFSKQLCFSADIAFAEFIWIDFKRAMECQKLTH